MTTIQTMLQVEFVGGLIELSINGAKPLSLFSDSYTIFGSGIEEYLVPGKNTLHTKFTLTKQPVQPIQFRTRVTRMDVEGEFMMDVGEELTSLGWKRTDDDPQLENGETLSREGIFEVEEVWDWPWKTELELTPELRAELDEAVTELCTIYQQRNTEAAQALYRPYHDAMTRNYGEESASLSADLDDLLADEQFPWIFDKVETTEFSYRAVCGGRFIDCVDAEGRSLLRLKTFEGEDGGEVKVDFPLLLWRAEDGRLLPAY